jgi:hypothetical protein
MNFTRTVTSVANHWIEHPLLWGVYLGVALLCFLLYLNGFLQQKYSYVYLALVFSIVISVTVNATYDTPHHVFRIAVLHDKIDDGHLGVFVINPFAKDALPVFLYYSLIPYIAPLILTFLYVPAYYAYAAGLGIYFLILIRGTWMLSMKLCSSAEHANLITILFVSTNYLISLWVSRSAAAEILAFSLVPWVTLALVETPRSVLRTTTLLALQAAAHPIVFPLCAAAEVVACIAFVSLRNAFKAVVTPLVLALAISSPFWAPQLHFLHAVRGNSGIPVHFESTFLTVSDLLNPLSVPTPGLWGFAAVVVIGLSVRFRGRVAVLLGLFLCTILFQTVYVKDIIAHIPLLGTVQFIWRWMLVSCFLVLVLLLASVKINTVLLRTISALAVCNAFVICGIHLTINKQVESRIATDLKFRDNQTVILDYFSTRLDQSDPMSRWGIGEYLPDYAGYPATCPEESLPLHFSDVEKGIPVSTSSVLSIQHAPIRFVRYRLNGTDVDASSFCDERLLFGPFPEAGTFTVNEDIVTLVSAARYVVLVVLFAGLGLVYKEACRGSAMAVSRRTA